MIHHHPHFTHSLFHISHCDYRLKAHMEREAQAEERARDWARVRVRVSGGDEQTITTTSHDIGNNSDDHTEGEEEDSNEQHQPQESDEEEEEEEEQDYIYPQLTLAGAVCAAAITCLGQVDMQATIIGERKTMADTAVCVVGCYSFGENRIECVCLY